MMVPSMLYLKICSGRTVVFSVLAPGLMKQMSVPGTRIDTWPNIPIVPCMFSMRVSVAVFSRKVFSSLMKQKTPSGSLVVDR
ncbi:MAG: hypothetical protein NTV56_02640 [Alphaproteobacteria bacterium]|nr:hypothetical protein [Alphaproteobacteria bacterium]